MEYRLIAINPMAPDGSQATVLEKHLKNGWELHGHPFVWNNQVLQAIIKPAEKLQKGPETAKRG